MSTRFTRSLICLLALPGLLGGLSSAARAQFSVLFTTVDLPNNSDGVFTSLTFFSPSFPAFSGPLQVTTVFNGIFSSLRGNTQGVVGGSALMETFANEDNIPFATGTPLGTFSVVPVGGFSDSATSTQIVHGWKPTGPLFTLSHKYSLVVPAHTTFHGDITTTIEPDTAVATVPEPGEWAAMGILASGLGVLVVRKRRAA